MTSSREWRDEWEWGCGDETDGLRKLADAAPELALGILPGDERAAALAHLDECPGCRQQVSSLAGVTDQLLLLTPTAEPQAGFEQRVLASLGTSPNRVRAPRVKWPAVRVTAAALVLAACIALAVLVISKGSSEPSSLTTEPMRTASGAVVGKVFVHREPPPSVHVAARLGGAGEVVRSSGRPTRCGSNVETGRRSSFRVDEQ